MNEKSIEKSLLDQLKMKGADLDHFNDLVGDYMRFWDIKTKLYEDIKKRGVMFEDNSSVGVKMQKNNPSVKELTSVNKQMLTILEKLDINTKNVMSDKDEEL